MCLERSIPSGARGGGGSFGRWGGAALSGYSSSPTTIPPRPGPQLLSRVWTVLPPPDPALFSPRKARDFCSVRVSGWLAGGGATRDIWFFAGPTFCRVLPPCISLTHLTFPPWGTENTCPVAPPPDLLPACVVVAREPPCGRQSHAFARFGLVGARCGGPFPARAGLDAAPRAPRGPAVGAPPTPAAPPREQPQPAGGGARRRAGVVPHLAGGQRPRVVPGPQFFGCAFWGCPLDTPGDAATRPASRCALMEPVGTGGPGTLSAGPGEAHWWVMCRPGGTFRASRDAGADCGWTLPYLHDNFGKAAIVAEVVGVGLAIPA